MRKSLLIAGGLIILVVVVGVVVLYGGFYNVAASNPHNAFMRWLLETGMRQSVAAHAPESEPPDLADPAMIVVGARHFETACAPCHGGPGVAPDPMADEMLPRPPPLAGKVDDFADNELFWIVLNGLKYTGMPGWPEPAREDEVWRVVAFIRLLPEMTADAFAALTPDFPANADAAAIPGIVLRGGDRGPATACVRCHGVDGLGDPSGAFPRIAGLPFEYLREQLDAFATGRRPSGVMRTALIGLSAEERAAAAAYYAALAAVDVPTTVDGDASNRGAEIAYRGLPARSVPPCTACHLDPETNAPPIAGQYPGYLRAQLLLFRAGIRTGNVMNAIAAELSDDEIAALADFFASLE